MRSTLGLVSVLLAGVSWARHIGAPYKRQNSTVPPSAGTAPYNISTPPLATNWTYIVGTKPWQDYPRPLLERSDWVNLNGVWQYQNSTAAAANAPPFGQDLAQSVLVPFCLESGLSGKYYIDMTSTLLTHQ